MPGCQFLLFFLAYNGYQVVRGLTDSGTPAAYVNAYHVIDVERRSGRSSSPASSRR